MASSRKPGPPDPSRQPRPWLPHRPAVPSMTTPQGQGCWHHPPWQKVTVPLVYSEPARDHLGPPAHHQGRVVWEEGVAWINFVPYEPGASPPPPACRLCCAPSTRPKPAGWAAAPTRLPLQTPLTCLALQPVSCTRAGGAGSPASISLHHPHRPQPLPLCTTRCTGGPRRGFQPHDLGQVPQPL